MEGQFRPLVRKPLDLLDVKALCEKSAQETSNDLCMLAILNSFLGNTQEAVALCKRVQEVPPPRIAPSLDYEEKRKGFARSLLTALSAGKERAFLSGPWKDDATESNPRS
jgi:hypothetical protein